MSRRLGLLLLVGLLSGPTSFAVAPASADEDRPAVRRDAHGDPLPPAARARIGTLRLQAGGRITQMAFLADGKVLITLAEGKLTAWDITSGKEVHPLKDLPETCNALALSQTGRMLAVTDGDSSSGMRRQGGRRDCVGRPSPAILLSL